MKTCFRDCHPGRRRTRTLFTSRATWELQSIHRLRRAKPSLLAICRNKSDRKYRAVMMKVINQVLLWRARWLEGKSRKIGQTAKCLLSRWSQKWGRINCVNCSQVQSLKEKTMNLVRVACSNRGSANKVSQTCQVAKRASSTRKNRDRLIIRELNETWPLQPW